ncbi:MAG: aldose 1-epimerase family protein [Bacillota bacterium]|nr:aldose 1-epimerase family protein [Bacillota bacterium]
MTEKETKTAEVRLSNGRLAVAITALGAELLSLRSEVSGQEYLWQGDPYYWSGRATNLFPVCGRFDGGSYSLDGQDYEMMIHGFAKEEIFQVRQDGERAASFALEENETTLRHWPRRFRYEIGYRLAEADEAGASRLEITSTVTNRDSRPLYFAIGGHPGFNIPLEEGLAFEDYRITFPAPERVQAVVLAESKLDSGERVDYALGEGHAIPLRHELFDEDGIFLSGTGGRARIEAAGSSRSVTVDYPGFDWLGIWQAAGKKSPYICIEPWTAMCGRHETHEALETMPGLVELAPGATRSWTWAITITE